MSKPECVCHEINSRNCPVHQNAHEVPREFWIANDRTDDNPFESFEAYEEHRQAIRRLYPNWEKTFGPLAPIHVIEKSAYDQLAKELEAARKEIDAARIQQMEVSKQFYGDKIQALEKELAEVRAKHE